MARLWSRGLILVVAGMVLGFGGEVAAQDFEARVEGRVVVADTGEPLEDALVRLARTGATTRTNGEGRFVFVVPPGRHTVVVEHIGYGRTEAVVSVVPGGRGAVELRLEAQPVALPAIRVLRERTELVGGGRDPIPGAAAYVSLAGPQDRGGFGDVHRVLRQVPGVYVQEEEGFGLRPNIGMRGTGSERSSKITVMEDGVLAAPAPYAAPAAYYFPTVGRMDAVEVRKGSSQIKYGPRTVGGALNLVSAGIPEQRRLDTELQGGSNGTRKVHARAGDTQRRFGWVAEAYHLANDGFKRLDGGGPTGFDLTDFLTKLRVNTDLDSPRYQELQLKLGRVTQESNETYLGLTQPDFHADPFRRYAGSQRDVITTRHHQVQLRHFVQATEALDLTTTVYRNGFRRDWYKIGHVGGRGIANVVADPVAYAAEMAILTGADSGPDAITVRSNNRDYDAQGVQTLMGLRISTGAAEHQLELGVRYHRDSEDRFQRDDGYAMQGGRMVLTSEGAPGSQDNRIGRAAAWAFFVQNRIALGDWWLTPGLRHERIRFERIDYANGDAARSEPVRVLENEVTVLIPGLGVSRALTPELSVFGGVHKGFGPPGPGAAQEVRPEESVNYELGLRWRGRAIGAEVVGFYSDYGNILGKATLASGEGGAGEIYNGGAVEVSGLEASLQADPAAWLGLRVALPVRVAYTFTRAEFGTSFQSDYAPWGTVEAGDRLPYLPEHQLSGSVGVEHRVWSARLRGSFSDGMRTVAGRGEPPVDRRTDSFVVFDISGEYELTSWGRLFATLENLTDRRYVVARHPAGARPGMPRTLNTGFRLVY